MNRDLNRRKFLKGTAGAALAFGFEEQALLAQAQSAATSPTSQPPTDTPMPKGKIGDIEISRLICGGNLISSFAHSRDLIYVSDLLKHYFTDEKVFETFQLCEQSGINTVILRLDANCERIISTYWRERGGKLQWIAQIKPRPSDLTGDARRAIDVGAVGVYIQGETGDKFAEDRRVADLAETLEFIKANGAIAGMGGHALDTIVASEKAGLKPDFYMKTFNAKRYWSAGPIPRRDSVWEETPDQTRDFMKTVPASWIAFKVLGAGAIPPQDGFQYAFEGGADFLCVGMFDFQVREDAAIAGKVLAALTNRERPWRA